ncbi:hypothetical protein TNCV_2717241 [Trichonephila clavipes]|nr:hypothetical protein TNCV_2717241 [Trichonephila clavipes]
MIICYWQTRLSETGSCAAKQFHSDASLEAVDPLSTELENDRGRRKVTLASDDRHPLFMAVKNRTASSRQSAAHWSTTPGVLMLAS